MTGKTRDVRRIHMREVLNAIERLGECTYDDIIRELDLPEDRRGRKQVVRRCTILEHQGYVQTISVYRPDRNPFTGFITKIRCEPSLD